MVDEMLEHGGRLDAAIKRYGGMRDEWLDLSTGINPNAWPVPQLAHHCWQILPDQGAEGKLLNAARDYYKVGSKFDIVAGNGTQSLIELLPQLLEVKKAGVISPCYREHVHVWQKHGRQVTELEFGEEIPADLDVLTVVNPNNPDANIIPIEILLRWQSQLAERGGLLIIDEAFADAMPAMSFIAHMGDNTIILRSFGKFFGLAGLRLGFAVCSKELAKRIKAIVGPWAVSGPALEIGFQAFKDTVWIEKTIGRLEDESRQMADVLNGNGLLVEGINPLFIFARHERARQIYEGLANDKILVRTFAELPCFIRFGLCGSKQALNGLNKSLEQIMDPLNE